MKKKKQIVFLEAYSSVIIYKIAREFKKKGYETVLIRLLDPDKGNKDFYNDAYDKIININIDYHKDKKLLSILSILSKKSKSFLESCIKIMKLRPYVIIGRAPPSWSTAVFKIIFKKTPIIYFPTDIRTLYYPTKEIAKTKGGLSDFEIRAERFCFENADGIISKNNKEELEHINRRMLGDNIKLAKLQLNFHPYCSEEFITPLNKNKLSKKTKETHLVYIGTIGSIDKMVYYDSLLKSCKSLIKQKLHVHVYINSNTSYNNKESKKDFFKKYKDFPNINYFYIHKEKDPKEIIKEISKYDFGLLPPFYPFFFSDEDLDHVFGIGNKIATYLEAGLPFFYASDYKFIDEVLRRYGLALPVHISEKRDSLSNMTNRLKNINYKEMEKKILIARKEFNLQKHFSKLENFVEEVVNSRKNKKYTRFHT